MFLSQETEWIKSERVELKRKIDYNRKNRKNGRSL